MLIARAAEVDKVLLAKSLTNKNQQFSSKTGQVDIKAVPKTTLVSTTPEPVRSSSKKFSFIDKFAFIKKLSPVTLAIIIASGITLAGMCTFLLSPWSPFSKAKEEQTAPIKDIGKSVGKVKKIEAQKNSLSKEEAASGNRVRPSESKEKAELINGDMVVIQRISNMAEPFAISLGSNEFASNQPMTIEILISVIG